MIAKPAGYCAAVTHKSRSRYSGRAGVRLFIACGLERALVGALRNDVEKVFICRASSMMAAELFSKSSDPKNAFAWTEKVGGLDTLGATPTYNDELFPFYVLLGQLRVYLKKKICYRIAQV